MSLRLIRTSLGWSPETDHVLIGTPHVVRRAGKVCHVEESDLGRRVLVGVTFPLRVFNLDWVPSLKAVVPCPSIQRRSLEPLDADRASERQKRLLVGVLSMTLRALEAQSLISVSITPRGPLHGL